MENPNSKTMNTVKKIIMEEFGIEEGILKNDTALSNPNIGFDAADLVAVFQAIEEELNLPEESLDQHLKFNQDDIGNISVKHIAKAVEQVQNSK